MANDDQLMAECQRDVLQAMLRGYDDGDITVRGKYVFVGPVNVVKWCEEFWALYAVKPAEKGDPILGQLDFMIEQTLAGLRRLERLRDPYTALRQQSHDHVEGGCCRVAGPDVQPGLPLEERLRFEPMGLPETES
jgi:hypothetical protein